jgi:hypothetical protein
MIILLVLAVFALLGLIPAKIAQSKGHSFGLWWIYGFLFPYIAFFHASVFLEEKKNPKR